jgi:acetyl-CoA synthetase
MAEIILPPEDFKKKAVIKDETVYEQGQDIEAFWAKQAQMLKWDKKWDQVLMRNPPYYKWFLNGKINVSVNCLDRWITPSDKDKIAYIWEGEMGEVRKYTYDQLYAEVNKFANVLKKLGVKKGDIVSMYMPVIPELPIAMLACARIGAPHSVVFAGFSAESLRDRMEDAESKFLITADGYYRRGKVLNHKQKSDEAVDKIKVNKVVVVKRGGNDITMIPNRDYWWHELMADADEYCKPEEIDSEDLLFLMYTSGTTGKPKGVMHSTGGYLTGVLTTMKWVFDLHDDDIYWCTADIGWITGHSYMVYGPLAAHSTSILYEGSPDYPSPARWWETIEKYKVTIFYTAPTAIRMFMRWGAQWLEKHDLTSLRLLGSVGEPINPEAWLWYYRHVGNSSCPIVDTWWMTETGMQMITSLPGILPQKPGSATRPFPGISIEIRGPMGALPPGEKGDLVITQPWPSMLRGLYKAPEKYMEEYWGKYGPETFFTGDGAIMDQDNYLWLLGRIGDVLNVAGHRLGTAEVESALVDYPSVAEAAVVGIPDEIKGQVPFAYVSLAAGVEPSDDLKDKLMKHVSKIIGPTARPKDIIFSDDLPKTRSGKIMRRVLRNLVF